MSNLRSGATVALFFTGLDDRARPLGLLPADLTTLGLPGCTAYVSAEWLRIVPMAAGTLTPHARHGTHQYPGALALALAAFPHWPAV